jgi:phage terminase large subunit
MTIDFSKYYQPKPKQILAHRCRAKYLLFGGSMGSGKSYFLCGEAIKQATKHNSNRLVIVRKELSVLRRTTLVSFLSICPPQIIKNYNQTRLEITFVNGSILTFIDADIAKDPLLQKIKGLEVGWVGIDEASEISKDVYNILKSRLRWILPNGSKPSYEIRLTSNPENCWLIPTFIQSNNPDEVYIEALTSDNYSEDSEYVQALKDAFKDNPSLLRKYLYADWSLTDSINQLIPSETIINCSKHVQKGYYGTALGVDVARYGNDMSVFILLRNDNIELIESYPQTSITEVITKAIQIINDYYIPANCVGVDAVGVGAGVVDGLRQQGYNIVEIQGSEKPKEIGSVEAFKPYNLRSQMYWELRKSLIGDEVGNIQTS